jgi:hypothetical protein
VFVFGRSRCWSKRAAFRKPALDRGNFLDRAIVWAFCFLYPISVEPLARVSFGFGCR